MLELKISIAEEKFVRRAKSERRFSRSFVVLVRSTTWRCGRLERLIVSYLRGRTWKLGKPQISIKEMLQNFKLKGKRKNEFLDAIRRLERRNIVRILTF